jgi:hypothetical protein
MEREKIIKLSTLDRPPPQDAEDIARLFDSEFGDAITEDRFLSIVVNKPRDFFRTHPNKIYRPRTEIYTHCPEGAIEKEHYIIAPEMRGRIEEARPCTLVTVIDREGNPRLWPIPLPREGERDNDAWTSARTAARICMDLWGKLIWAKRSYKVRKAMPGYAPEPDWPKVPPFEELVRLGFGEHGIIKNTDHPIYRELFGAAPEANDDADESI